MSARESEIRSRRQTCLYFGTFNPIHTGHLMIAQAVLNQFSSLLGFDSVTFIPAAHPPHRHGETDLLDSRRRLRMVSLATGEHPSFRVDDIELRRAGPSYTIDTLHALREQGKVQFPAPLIIGSDALASLASWREPHSLVESVCFLQAPRPGCEPVYEITPPNGAQGGGKLSESRPLRLDTRIIEMPMLDLSASWIRKRIQERHDSLRYFLPDSVWRYIRDNALYS